MKALTTNKVLKLPHMSTEFEISKEDSFFTHAVLLVLNNANFDVRRYRRRTREEIARKISSRATTQIKC